LSSVLLGAVAVVCVLAAIPAAAQAVAVPSVAIDVLHGGVPTGEPSAAVLELTLDEAIGRASTTTWD
jgi:hypothetical protein